MSLKTTLLAASAFLASANAHMIMANPVPFSKDKIDNGPINDAQYPCKANLGFEISQMNKMKVGEKQKLSFSGSAIHGGGSCQLAITTDKKPTKDSKFKVIKSIEGGCPGINGPDTFDFELPASVPNGQVTFAWTWFARMSGGPEMYMNCAPVEVTGGAKDDSELMKLPDMFIANIGSTTCKTNSANSKGPIFPNPGAVKERKDKDDMLSPPTGDCGKAGSSPPAEGAPSPSAKPTAVEPPTGAPTEDPSTEEPPTEDPTTEEPPTEDPTTEEPPTEDPTTEEPSNTGGVFVPKPTGGAGGAPVMSTMVTSKKPAAPTGGAGGAPSKPTMPAAPIGTGVTPAPTGGAGAGGSSCTTDGAVVCNGPDQFGLCNHGKVVFQAVASGTTCTNGAIAKRGYNGRIARPRV